MADEQPDIPMPAPVGDRPVAVAPMGVLLLDKPVGPSSFAMVQRLRRLLGVKKIGHAGTLDPFASGLLILCVGRPATRIIDRIMGGNKVYEAILALGSETDTYDTEGEVTARYPVPALSAGQLHKVLAGFVGEQLQTPPAFSALKHRGKPLYYYARKGEPVVKAPRPIVIHRLEMLAHDGNFLTIRVVCGKGTYIRSLAFDIGRQIGCGAHLCGLRRLASGPFSVAEAIPGEQLGPDMKKRVVDNLLSPEYVLAAVAGQTSPMPSPKADDWLHCSTHTYNN